MLWYITDVYTMNLSENSDGMVNLNNNKSTNFIAITDVTTVVVKIPGATNDKYIK